ncbi:MAG: hypothetical protein R2838_05620 [Caldilineaceae bacterium]
MISLRTAPGEEQRTPCAPAIWWNSASKKAKKGPMAVGIRVLAHADELDEMDDAGA